eukprot:scaffold560435_cov52-Prasinocladus_malaysianus.AAC.1
MPFDRFSRRSHRWAFFPSDTLILSEREQKYGAYYDVGWQTINRLQKIGVNVPEKAMPPDVNRFTKAHTASEPLQPSAVPVEDAVSQPVAQHAPPSASGP